MGSVEKTQGRVSNWLANAPAAVFSVWAIGSAFCVYFCMYGFRKPFTAGEFEGAVQLGSVAMPYKTLLVISQVMGYASSKFIGVKLISETGRERRAVMILAAILFAELALVGFALAPSPWAAFFLFCNGLPLGLVFGLVLGYLEGRKVTEALAAGLCASFILSSGVVKSIGRALVLNYDVPEVWMPACTGAIFFLPLLGSVWCLKQIPPPAPEDIRIRSERRPVNAEERWAFFGRHALGLSMLVLVYIGLTVIRSFRDDFAVEIWNELGESKSPSIFARTEFVVMLLVVGLNGAAICVPGNRAAFFGSLWLLTIGFAASIAGVMLYRAGWMTPFAMMVACGVGLYVPYVAFHTTVFERLIASASWAGNIGFLMYVADSTGYLGYVGIMVAKSLGQTTEHALEFFLWSTIIVCAACIVMTRVASFAFARSLPKDKRSQA